MKILSAEQIRKADAYTIEKEPIPSIDLMEKASLAFVGWFVQNFNATEQIKVFCGTGNNGGDGLAIARLLSQRGYHVEIYVVRVSEKQSIDFQINYERLTKTLRISELRDQFQFPAINKNDVVVDGIFGSGLSKPVEGLFSQVIQHINNSASKVVSIDIPSGMFCDNVVDGFTINADYTVSFQVPKLAFFLPANYDYVGNWTVVEIGLNKQFINNCESNFSTIDDELVNPMLKKKNKNDHKGKNGRGLLISGSYGKMGAAILAGRAAMRSGIGLLTIHLPHCGYQVIQSSVPEAMVSADPTEFYFGEVPDILNYDAIGIGPGLDTKHKSVKALEELLHVNSKPMVIDADALNMLSENRHLINLIQANSILTPHYKEFERLAGSWNSDIDRIEKQQAFSKEHQCYVIFKGPNSTISTPEGKILFNLTGNPGMATGGSGDVLTGLLTSMLAQGYSAFEAAVLAVYIHGLAGDLAVKQVGMYGMIASDIISHLPAAFTTFR